MNRLTDFLSPLPLGLVLLASSVGSAWSGSPAELFGQGGNPSVTEFNQDERVKMNWTVVNDGVMGGLSQGKITFEEVGILRFSGTLSLENNGGFSSVRTDLVNLDLSGATGIALRVRGDGRTYQLRLATDARWRGREISFKSEFATEKGRWTEVLVPFYSFTGTWRGVDLPNEKFEPGKIQRLWLLLGDKKPGPFNLEVDWIRSYGDAK